MKLDYNLEEIFRLAFEKNPVQAEYYAMKILMSMPVELIYLGRRGQNEYELDEEPVTVFNDERADLEDLISSLRNK